MKDTSRKIKCDLWLATLLFASVLLIVFIFPDSTHRLYALTAAAVVVSLAHAYICRASSCAPFANDFLAIAFAAMGALLFHEVQETEREKLALVNEYASVKENITLKKIAARDLVRIEEILPDARAYILDWLNNAPNTKVVDVTHCQLVVIPPPLSRDHYPSDGAFSDEYAPTFRLDEFVMYKERVCTPMTEIVELPDYDATDTTHALIDHAVQRGHPITVTVNGQSLWLTAIKEVSQIKSTDGSYDEKIKELENSIRKSEEALSSIKNKYVSLSSIDAYDINSWRTKSFYSSWWSMLLMVSICYQLNSSVIFYQRKRS